MRDISSIKSTSSFKSLLKEGTETISAFLPLAPLRTLPLALTFNPRLFSINEHFEAGISVPSTLFVLDTLNVILTSLIPFTPASHGFETDFALADSNIKDVAL